MPLLLDAHDPNAAPREVPPDDADMGVRAGAYDYVGGTRYDLVSPDGVVGDAAAENVTTLLRRGYRFAGSSSPAAKAEPSFLDKAATAVVNAPGNVGKFVEGLYDTGAGAVSDVAKVPKALAQGDLREAASQLYERSKEAGAGLYGLVPFHHTLFAGASQLVGDDEAANMAELRRLEETPTARAAQLAGFAKMAGGAVAGAAQPAAVSAAERLGLKVPEWLASAGGAASKVTLPSAVVNAGEAAAAAMRGALGEGALASGAATAARLGTEGAVLGAESAIDNEIADGRLAEPGSVERIASSTLTGAIDNLAVGTALHGATAGVRAAGRGMEAAGKYIKPLQGVEAEQARVAHAQRIGGAVRGIEEFQQKANAPTVEGEHFREAVVNYRAERGELLGERRAAMAERGAAKAEYKGAEAEREAKLDAAVKELAAPDEFGTHEEHAEAATRALEKVLPAAQRAIDEGVGDLRKDFVREHMPADGLKETTDAVLESLRDAREKSQDYGDLYTNTPSVFKSATKIVNDAEQRLYGVFGKDAIAFQAPPADLQAGTPEFDAWMTRRAAAMDSVAALPPDVMKAKKAELWLDVLQPARREMGKLIDWERRHGPPGDRLAKSLYVGNFARMMENGKFFGDAIGEATKDVNARTSKLIDALDDAHREFERKVMGDWKVDSAKVASRLSSERASGSTVLNAVIDNVGIHSNNMAEALMRHHETDPRVAPLVKDIADGALELTEARDAARRLHEAEAIQKEVRRQIKESPESLPSTLRNLAAESPEMAKIGARVIAAEAKLAQIRGAIEAHRALTNIYTNAKFEMASVGNVVKRSFPGRVAMGLLGIESLPQAFGKLVGGELGMLGGMYLEARHDPIRAASFRARLDAYARSHVATVAELTDKAALSWLEKGKLAKAKFAAGFSPTARSVMASATSSPYSELTPIGEARRDFGNAVRKRGAALAKARPFPASALTASQRDLFLGAVNTVQRAAANADKAHGAVAAVLGDGASEAPQTLGALGAKLQEVVGFLESKIPPSQPAVLGQVTRDDAGVSRDDADKFLRYFEAAVSPTSVLESVASGQVSREGVETLQALYPTIYKDLQDDFTARIEALKEPLPYKAQVLLGTLFDLPTTPTLDPAFVQRVQGAYMSDNQPSEGMGPGRGAPRPVASHQAQETATPAQKLAGA